MRDFLPALVLLAVLLLGLIAATFGANDRGEGYLVVAPPGWSLARTTGLVRGSGGRLVRPGGFANVVIAASADPGFGQALKLGGALYARRVPGPLGCSAPQPEGKGA